MELRSAVSPAQFEEEQQGEDDSRDDEGRHQASQEGVSCCGFVQHGRWNTNTPQRSPDLAVTQTRNDKWQNFSFTARLKVQQELNINPAASLEPFNLRHLQEELACLAVGFCVWMLLGKTIL